MDLKNVVVFGTRHLESRHPVFPGQSPIHVEIFRGQRLQTYSTGRLEQAQALGLTVYVVSIRPAFGPHDEWWRRCLPPENVLNSADILMSTGADGALASAFRPWRELYGRLGISWPTGRFRDFDDPARYLIDRHGTVDPAHLTGQPQPN